MGKTSLSRDLNFNMSSLVAILGPMTNEIAWMSDNSSLLEICELFLEASRSRNSKTIYVGS